MRLIQAGALLAAATLYGCVVAAVAVVAVAVGVGVGTYLYLENTLSYEYDADLDAVWTAAKDSAGDLKVRIEGERKDFQSGTLDSHMADGRVIRISCEKIGDKKTRVCVRTGDFAGESNRYAAHCIHEAIARRLGLRAPGLPPSEKAEADEVQRTYGVGLEACYEAAMKSAVKAGYKAELYELHQDSWGSLSARSGERRLYVTLNPLTNRTRVVVQARGGAGPDDNRKVAKEFHDILEAELKVKGEDR